MSRPREDYSLPFRPIEGSTPAPVHLARGCRWPVHPHSDPLNSTATLFCDAPRLEGKSYCPAHHAMSVGEGTVSERGAHKALEAMA